MAGTPKPGQALDPEESKRVKKEIGEIIREFVMEWHTETQAALNEVRLPLTNRSQAYAWTAAAGNGIWALASVVPQGKIWSMAAGAVLSFGGAGVGAAPGLISAYEAGTKSHDSMLDSFKELTRNQLRKAKDRMLEASNLLNLQTLFFTLCRDNGHLATDLADPRRAFIWNMMFRNIPYLTKTQSISSRTKLMLNEYFSVVEACFIKYESFINTEAVRRFPPAATGSIYIPDGNARSRDAYRSSQITPSAYLKWLNYNFEYRQFLQKNQLVYWLR